MLMFHKESIMIQSIQMVIDDYKIVTPKNVYLFENPSSCVI